MNNKDEYLTLKSAKETEIKINKSRFIANAFHIESKDEFQKFHTEIKKKFYDARHHPFAYIMRTEGFRYNDDGEPSGTSGMPVYEAIEKHNLTDTMVIVTRYFGGIKLGTGGLKRAYFQAADECLMNAKIEKKFLYDEFKFEVDFSFISQVMKLFEKYKVITKEDTSSVNFSGIILIRKSLTENLKSELINNTNGKIIIY